LWLNGNITIKNNDFNIDVTFYKNKYSGIGARRYKSNLNEIIINFNKKYEDIINYLKEE
jgi:CRISPR/Cas system CMR-associated protein Cmr5 small subunit